MSMSATDFHELMGYIAFRQKGGDLTPQLDQLDREKRAEIQQTVESLSKQLGERQEQAVKILVGAVKELEAMPFGHGVDNQISNLQATIAKMMNTQTQLTEQNAMADQEIRRRAEERAYLKSRAEDLRRQFENISAQSAPFEKELLTIGNNYCRYLGDVPEITK
jgi:chromosome segregation ATPase